MSSVKINGKKYKARRLLFHELAEFGFNDKLSAKFVSTPAGERLAIKKDDKWIFHGQKPSHSVRL